MIRQTVFALILLSCSTAWGLYSSNGDVLLLTPSNFNKHVNSDEPILVEFFAPWCGHCKSLAPEYEKLAKAMKGVAKVAAVDAHENPSLAQPYGVQGFPTIKFFGMDRTKPLDYNGPRTAQGMSEFVLRELNKVVTARLSGKAKPSSSSSSSSKKSESGKAKAKTTGGNMIELTEDSFNELVLQSDEPWAVEFYAPWCGHCQRLAPAWKRAASELDGQVKFGAVDATVHQSLAQKYGIRGYPTIKFFQAGVKAKSSPQDYNGGRTADDIIAAAKEMVVQVVAAPEVLELTSQEALDKACGKASTCIVSVLPHILDSQAKGRNKFLSTLRAISEKFKRRPFSYLWTEAGKQPQLESALGLGGFGYPAVAAINLKKNRSSVMVTAFTEKNLEVFLNELLAGKAPTQPLSDKGVSAVSVAAWDGKDANVESASSSDDIVLDIPRVSEADLEIDDSDL